MAAWSWIGERFDDADRDHVRMSLNSTLVDVPPYGSPEWVEARKRGLGASEVSILTGDDRYRGEWDLAATKRGEAPDVEESWPMRMGHIMEPIALDAYERLTGRSPLVRGETWSDRRWPHVFASLDARWERIGVEAKWTNRWPADAVPRSILIQAYVQMGCADLTAVDIVRVSSREAPEVVATVERNPDVEAVMDLAEAWWQSYMVEGKPLPVDASRAASRYLDKMQGPEDMDASNEQVQLAAQLRIVRGRMAGDEATERLITNRIKESMAGAYALAGPGFRISWRPSKERVSTDWKAICNEMEPGHELLDRFTTVSDGARPFRVTFEGEGIE